MQLTSRIDGFFNTHSIVFIHPMFLLQGTKIADIPSNSDQGAGATAVPTFTMCGGTRSATRRLSGNPFGRCAETYPFRKLLMGKVQKEAEQIWENVWDPCLNCEVLIKNHKGRTSNFGRWTECVGAPP
ncbi:hypothetical protein BO99DRAFT_413247 [Aspergillus violaceofuscus CBS 115571]|uniref:Uncharacterized protein n=1 Tax=Aspergillus violaceofuscus (strain CBS 115571) TaxID=1450538 RepID=A0A2V5H8U3_ASPV1|nr:hypothetical protein BO99DRAFT_413247 [Aspergillus violaceofuscus CBS 115571]